MTKNTKPMTEKMNLYMRAKEAYYAGNPIMEDFEFDELEKELGLENKAYVGTKHNASYTVQHPFIMGSLSKIQIKKDNDGNIDWTSYWTKLCKFIPDGTKVIITPKFDGCSFEIKVNNHNIDDISTRGDGEYGRDIKKHLINQATDAIKNITLDDEFTLRGEVLINKEVFAQKYSEFVNPRSFVAGVLGRDYCEDADFQEMLSDLSIVIYDVRINDEGNWIDNDWTIFKKDLYTGLGYIDDKYLPEHFIEDEDIDGPVDFNNIYNEFSEYRIVCPFALDGIVIKPMMSTRINNLTESRPKDCVAIKFVPMLEETEVTDIEWKVSKTGEWIPVVITKPVVMDGKAVKRASGSNYGNLLDKKISIGTKVILSLAGDIIPFIYKITDTASFNENKMNTPENSFVDGCHLMAVISDEDKARINFINSSNVLKIDKFGPALATKVFDYALPNNDETADFFGEDNSSKEMFDNILFCTPEDIYFGCGAGKTGANCKKSFETVLNNITLNEIILSCNFRFCGSELSKDCANYLMGLPYDFTSKASEGYNWLFDTNSVQYQKVMKIMKHLSKTFEDFAYNETKADSSENEDTKIGVILTGDPNNYQTKAEFMRCHPEYKEVKTTKAGWNECQILFTNNLNSTTNKMKEAIKRGIKIELY